MNYAVLTFHTFSIWNEAECFLCYKQIVGKIPLAFEGFNLMRVSETSYNQLVGKLSQLRFPQ
jgi:hypothetical protein